MPIRAIEEGRVFMTIQKGFPEENLRYPEELNDGELNDGELPEEENGLDLE